MKKFLIILIVVLVTGCSSSQNINDANTNDENINDADTNTTNITVTLPNGEEGLAMTVEQLSQLPVEELTVDNWTKYYDASVDTNTLYFKLKDGFYETKDTSMKIINKQSGNTIGNISNSTCLHIEPGTSVDDYDVQEASGEIIVSFPSEYIYTLEDDVNGEPYDAYCLCRDNKNCMVAPLDSIGEIYSEYKTKGSISMLD